MREKWVRPLFCNSIGKRVRENGQMPFDAHGRSPRSGHAPAATMLLYPDQVPGSTEESHAHPCPNGSRTDARAASFLARNSMQKCDVPKKTTLNTRYDDGTLLVTHDRGFIRDRVRLFFCTGDGFSLHSRGTHPEIITSPHRSSSPISGGPTHADKKNPGIQ